MTLGLFISECALKIYNDHLRATQQITSWLRLQEAGLTVRYLMTDLFRKVERVSAIQTFLINNTPYAKTNIVTVYHDDQLPLAISTTPARNTDSLRVDLLTPLTVKNYNAGLAQLTIQHVPVELPNLLIYAITRNVVSVITVNKITMIANHDLQLQLATTITNFERVHTQLYCYIPYWFYLLRLGKHPSHYGFFQKIGNEPSEEVSRDISDFKASVLATLPLINLHFLLRTPQEILLRPMHYLFNGTEYDAPDRAYYHDWPMRLRLAA